MLTASPRWTLQAQTLSLFTGSAITEHPELGDPSEFGVAVTIDFASRFLVKIAYTNFGSTSDRTEEICTWYEPRHMCDMEAVHGDSHLSGISVAALPYVQIIEGVRLAAGGGVGINRIDSQIEGESGRASEAFIPRTGMYGGVALLSVRVGPSDRIPLFLAVNAVNHWVRLNGCVTETPRYDPFCGTQRFQSFEVELGYDFPLMR